MLFLCFGRLGPVVRADCSSQRMMIIAAAHVMVNEPGAEVEGLKVPGTPFSFDIVAGTVDVDIQMKVDQDQRGGASSVYGVMLDSWKGGSSPICLAYALSFLRIHTLNRIFKPQVHLRPDHAPFGRPRHSRAAHQLYHLLVQSHLERTIDIALDTIPDAAKNVAIRHGAACLDKDQHAGPWPVLAKDHGFIDKVTVGRLDCLLVGKRVDAHQVVSRIRLDDVVPSAHGLPPLQRRVLEEEVTRVNGAVLAVGPLLVLEGVTWQDDKLIKLLAVAAAGAGTVVAVEWQECHVRLVELAGLNVFPVCVSRRPSG